jgi:hypothetical protein
MIKTSENLATSNLLDPRTPFGVSSSANILKENSAETFIQEKTTFRIQEMSTTEKPLLRLNILAIKKLMNHMKMMYTLEKSKDLLMRITKTNVKLVVYDNKFSEICYLGILDKKFFDIYEFRDIVTVRLEDVKVFMKLLKINFKNVSI